MNGGGITTAVLGLALSFGASSTSVGCSRKRTAPTESARTGTPEPQSATPVATGDASEERPSALAEARYAVTGHMNEHFVAAIEIQSALVTGGLEAAREPARWLAEHRPEGVPADWMPFVLAMREAAEKVERARDLPAAARATGDIALACGQCHQALEVSLSIETPPLPPPGPDTSTQMRRHAWAADRLWEGITLPSDAAWTRGARAFTGLPRCSEDPGARIDRADIETLRTRVRELESDAIAATDAETRAAVYGELLGTCGTCHLSGC